MDVVIHTSDPEAVDRAAIRALLEAEDYFVLTVTVHPRQ